MNTPDTPDTPNTPNTPVDTNLLINSAVASVISKQNYQRLTNSECITKFGLIRSELHHSMLNDFYLPTKVIDAMSVIVLIERTGSYLTKKLSAGTLVHNFEPYNVVYKDCTPARAKRAKSLLLSFRKPIPELGLPMYVLVTIPYNVS